MFIVHSGGFGAFHLCFETGRTDCSSAVFLLKEEIDAVIIHCGLAYSNLRDRRYGPSVSKAELLFLIVDGHFYAYSCGEPPGVSKIRFGNNRLRRLEVSTNTPVASITVRLPRNHIAWNASPLHFGHGQATSLGTGRVKCFT
jgi:hypothetical protein